MNPRLKEQPSFAGIASLSGEKLQVLQSTLNSILASPAAEEVYAQLINGKRTQQLHPLESRDEVATHSDSSISSDSAIQLYRNIRRSLKLQLLKVDMNVYLSNVISRADTNGDTAGPAIPKYPNRKPRA